MTLQIQMGISNNNKQINIIRFFLRLHVNIDSPKNPKRLNNPTEEYIET